MSYNPTTLEISGNTLTLGGGDGNASVDLAPMLSVCEHHRMYLPDNPTTDNFNWQRYKWSEWIGVVSSASYSTPDGSYTSAGLRWRERSDGYIELFGDVQNTVETWIVDVVFFRIDPTRVQRYGF